MTVGITGISRMAAQPLSPRTNRKAVGFSSQQQDEYSNPVSIRTEKMLSLIGPTALSLVVGTVAGFATKSLTKAKTATAVTVGALATAVTALATIPGAVYAAKNRATMRNEQWNVYGAERKAATNIARGIHQEAKDPDMLSQAIDHQLKFKTSENGNGMAFITTNS